MLMCSDTLNLVILFINAWRFLWICQCDQLSIHFAGLVHTNFSKKPKSLKLAHH